MFQVQLVERGRCENISTLHLSPPALASASLTENTELSVLRLALEPWKRIRPAKGGSVEKGKSFRRIKKSREGNEEHDQKN